jgi:hypothetical protein
MADTELAEPMVALSVAVPEPAQCAGLRRRGGAQRAGVAALLLSVDVVAPLPIKRDVGGDGSIDLGAEFLSALAGELAAGRLLARPSRLASPTAFTAPRSRGGARAGRLYRTRKLTIASCTGRLRGRSLALLLAEAEADRRQRSMSTCRGRTPANPHCQAHWIRNCIGAQGSGGMIATAHVQPCHGKRARSPCRSCDLLRRGLSPPNTCC